MATHDYVIANGTGAAVRSDLNGALAAIVSNNSGATEPGTMYAYQWWADTTTGLLKLRNSANNAWITLRELDGTLTIEDGTAAAPGLAFTSDLNTGLFRVGADQVAISTGGTSRLAVSTTAVSSTLAVDAPLGAVGTPSLTFTGDLNTGIYSPGADQVAITTGGTARLNADTAAVTSTLPVVHPLGAVATPSITFTGDLNTGIWSPAADTIAFSEGGAEAMRIDSSSRLLVGTSNSTDNIRLAQKFAVVSTGASNAGGAMLTSYSGTSPDVPSILDFQRSRGTTDGSFTAVATGDGLGALIFRGANGSAFANAAWIRGEVDSGTVSGSSMPGRLVFSTTADGASSPTERMRINQKGELKVTTTGNYPSATTGGHQFRTAENLPTLTVDNNIGSGFADTVLQVTLGYAANTTNSYFLYCNDTAAGRMYVRTNGGIGNYQANNVNLSDRNLKKDISPAADTWDCIKEWEIVNYRYKDQPDDADLNLGVIAQQVAESCPEVITVFEEAKDDQPEKLGVKEQQMYWMAIKALQEAQVRIEALETEVAALKAQ